MNAEAILQWMQSWVDNNDYEYKEPFAEQLVTDIIDSSMDVVEFTMDVEEELGTEEELDLEDMAPKFATLNFGQLAAELESLASK